MKQHKSVYLVQQMKKRTNLKLDECMPKTVESSHQFQGSVSEILDKLSNLVNRHGLEVRLTHFRYPWMEETLTYYNCRLRRKTSEAMSERKKMNQKDAVEIDEAGEFKSIETESDGDEEKDDDENGREKT